MKKLAFLILSVIALTSCETDVEVNAPYKQIPVIYGLLDASQDYQYIKINRSFLTETNALIAAQNPDSNFYQNVEPVIQVLVGGEVESVIPLRDTVLADRDEGDFYTSPNKMYYFRNNGRLETGKVYQLLFETPEGAVEARTIVLEQATMSQPGVSQPSIPFVRNNVEVGGDTEFSNPFNIKVNGIKNARKFEGQFHFFYNEVYQDGTEEEKKVVVELADYTTSNLGGTDQYTNASIDGKAFFNRLANTLSTDDDNVVRREIGHINLEVYVANDDFNTFLQANEPSTGVVLEKPSWTNISVGEEAGIGVFASRTVFNYNDFRAASTGNQNKLVLDRRTERALVRDVITRNLKFCSKKLDLQDESDVACP